MKGNRFRCGLPCVELAFILWLAMSSVLVAAVTGTTVATPRVVFMIPAQSRSSHQLNERNTLTNKLESGWIMKSGQEAEYMIYVLIDEDINDMTEIKASFVHFTTSSSQCVTPAEKENVDELMTRTFPLKFLKGKSKIHQNASSKLKTKRFVGDKSISENSQNSTLLVGKVQVTLAHSTSKYYLCFFFEKQLSGDDDTNEYSDEMEYLKQRVNYDSFVHQGQSNPFIQIITTKDLLPIYLVVIFYFTLLCFSALFSGLNLGLMSLDLTELSILKKCGTKKEKVYATKIYPLRRKGNLLLCTILIGNVLVNSTSTLILGNYLEGIFAALGSTLLIVIFGEIIPQAVCSRHGLAVGAFTRYVTYTMLALTFVVSYPLSLVLDFFLGKEIAVSYSRDKVRELMRQAVSTGPNTGLEQKQFKLISGALDFKHKKVKEIMVPIKDVFSLDINSILDFDTFKTILYHGYSRIPVYEHTKENLVGMILIQDLLLNDPADKVPLRVVMDYYKHKVPKCHLESMLESMFDLFRKGDSHMAFVYKTKGEATNDGDNEGTSGNGGDQILALYDSNNNNITTQINHNMYSPLMAQDNLDDSNLLNEAVGILTLEDIIEELVQSEIMDEADTKRERRRKRAREFLKGKLKSSASLSNENLNIFVTEADQTNKPLISTQIRRALYYFLAFCVRPFSEEFVSPKLLEAFLKQPELVIEKRNLSGYESDTSMLLYQYGVESDYFIIILDGNALLEVGGESGSIEINAGLFSYYGVHALVDESVQDAKQILSLITTSDTSSTDLSTIPPSSLFKPYKPEFNLRVDSYCVYMKITRAEWLDVVKKSELLKVVK